MSRNLRDELIAGLAQIDAAYGVPLTLENDAPNLEDDTDPARARDDRARADCRHDNALIIPSENWGLTLLRCCDCDWEFYEPARKPNLVEADVVGVDYGIVTTDGVVLHYRNFGEFFDRAFGS